MEMEQRNVPDIVVTSRDLTRLNTLIDSISRTAVGRALDFLRHELDRAAVVPPQEIARNIVTMRTMVRYRDDDTGDERLVTLVYPGEEDIHAYKISVLTPVGTALLGLARDQSIAYRTIDGREKRITVLEVIHQPEAVNSRD